MKQLFYLLIACTLFICSCDKNGNQDGEAPTCEITSPADGAIIDPGMEVLISGTGSAPGSSIASVALKVNGEAIPAVNEVPFEYTLAPESLKTGRNVISLTVTNSLNLSAEHEVSITVLEVSGDLTISPSSLEFGYYTEEAEFTITTESRWTVTIPESAWITVYNEQNNVWETKDAVSGTGNQTIKIQSVANAKFTDNSTALSVTTANTSREINITQAASPDIFMFLEDENLRMAAQISMFIYGIDQDEDGKMSAWEVEQEPEEGAPYGIDAGQWGVLTTKGIEYFPYLRHLDVNNNPDLTEIDLSGNTDLMSIHVQGCTSLSSLNISHVPKLMELGCDHTLYTTLDLSPLKTQLHTLAVLNRTEGPSVIDLSGFTALSRLYIYNNGLTELDISGCTSLWLLSAGGNDFTELDLSEVDRDPDNSYIMTDCPYLARVYVWPGFTLDYYYIFSVDEGVEIIEKN